MGRKYRALELNEKNVYTLLQESRATPETKLTRNCTFMRSNPKVEVLTLDQEKMDFATIRYLLGQLKVAHDLQEKLKKMDDYYTWHRELLGKPEDDHDWDVAVSLTDMAVDYRGRLWTRKMTMVFALCYLGAAVFTLPQFKDYGGQVLADFFEDYKEHPVSRYFAGSYAPDDPRFNERYPFIGQHFEEYENVEPCDV